MRGEPSREGTRRRSEAGERQARLLFALAGAAIDHPDETVRTALYPVVSETTLRQLVKEAKASEQLFRHQVRKEIRGSYSHHYRRMLPRILDALEFRCANSVYRPVMDALELLQGHVDTPGQQRFYPPDDRVPIAGVVPDQWREAVIDEHGKIERIPYELSVLRALRDALRRGEIYVSGAHRWRDPDVDLPADFDTNRDVHYAAIRQPRAAEVFIADLQARLHAGLDRLDQAVRTNTAGGVRITTRRGRPWIVVPAMGLPQAATGRSPLEGLSMWVPTGHRPRNTGMSSLAVRTVRDNSVR